MGDDAMGETHATPFEGASACMFDFCSRDGRGLRPSVVAVVAVMFTFLALGRLVCANYFEVAGPRHCARQFGQGAPISTVGKLPVAIPSLQATSSVLLSAWQQAEFLGNHGTSRVSPFAQSFLCR